jgi:hypothetical protein
MGKFFIEESEIKSIKRLYGLITEDIDKELLDYGNSYIDNNDCNKIYNDLKKFQSAANSGQVKISDEDKKELSENLEKINTYKGFACGRIKKEMKKSFSEQSQNEPEKLKVYMCWFATNVSQPQTPLRACEPPKQNVPDPVTPQSVKTTTEIKPVIQQQSTPQVQKQNVQKIDVSVDDILNQ